MTIKIIEMLIPKSNTFTRPGIKRKPTSITIHETDNENVRANALAHARLQYNGNRRQASWNYSVDDEPEVYLSIPENEMTYHAGNSKGNRDSISIEICVNRDGNFKKAVSNAIKLSRYLINKYPSITEVDVVQHNYWSGKNCPRRLRAGTKGIDWNAFIKGVRTGKAEVVKPKKAPKYKQTSGSFGIGQTVILKNSATHYATGERIPSRYKGKTYTVMQRGSNRILLKELYSWVHTKDLVGGKKTPSKTSSNSSSSTIYTVGGKVTIKLSAKTYATGENIPSKYKGKTYTIQQVKSDRILLKELYSWVRKSDLVGRTSSSNKSTSNPIFKVGRKVTLKNSAKRYATGENIPSRYKGKSYTIQQVKKDRVLLKELYSWVNKKDLS